MVALRFLSAPGELQRQQLLCHPPASQHQQTQNTGSRRDDGRSADAGQLVQVELQAQPEHQDDDPDFAPGPDGRLIGHGEEIGHKGPQARLSTGII